MSTPERNSLAIIGAGPVGLEAALAALDAGFDVHVFEQGEPGAHPLAWGHVRLFTPWSMNLGPASVRHLLAAGWREPDAADFPTGAEYVERYVQPLAALPELKDRLHTHTQVVHVGRRGLLKSDHAGNPQRREHPFRLLVRDQGGREQYLHAFTVIDASGVYAQPNWAGDGGIPARQELYLAPQMAYHIEDVLGVRRDVYAGKRTMVIGGGASAATSLSDLLTLADQAEGTRVVWVTRKAADELFPEKEDDPLPQRAVLYQKARSIAGNSIEGALHIGGASVEGFEYNSATHQYNVSLRVGDEVRQERVDRVIVNTGYGPDNTIHRELQFHECWASQGPMKLSSALLDAGTEDCLDAPAFGADVLSNPEPDFYVLGNKSYGRGSNFLLETGFKQVADVVRRLTEDQLQSAQGS
jgi:thioredoxin reductase